MDSNPIPSRVSPFAAQDILLAVKRSMVESVYQNARDLAIANLSVSDYYALTPYFAGWVFDCVVVRVLLSREHGSTDVTAGITG